VSAFPRSIAIAGAWGYIGRLVLEAALRRGLRTYAYDPGPLPSGLEGAALTRIPDEADFYDLDADLFHLALHPEARRTAIERLLRRGASEPLCILNEKPMVSPDTPGDAPRLIEAVERSQVTMFFDFPELFDPLTRRITQFLSSFKRVELMAIEAERSKDREDPGRARNFKHMVPIQYQETVHCLAYVLHLLAALHGSFDGVLNQGISAVAQAEPYCPPNPEAYPRTVDGRCAFHLSLGSLAIQGLTNFKRGARWSKRRVLRGLGDGRHFVIEADYLEGRKWLRIDGVDQGWDPQANSYEAILSTLNQWRASVPAAALRVGPYPNPRLAWRAFQLSGVLWASSQQRRPIALAGVEALEAFDPGLRPHPTASVPTASPG
jgi:predicted dehydrogenase